MHNYTKRANQLSDLLFLLEVNTLSNYELCIINYELI